MKIYTRTGDEGTTGLLGGTRVLKCDLRIAACGAVDELNACLGVCRTSPLPAAVDAVVARLQHEMFALGAELAAVDPQRAGSVLLDESHVAQLEADVDRCDGRLAPLGEFILPGGTAAAATLHLARAVCRRAERETVALAQTAPLRPLAVVYLNRVSDLLFVLARAANAAAGVADAPWQKPR